VILFRSPLWRGLQHWGHQRRLWDLEASGAGQDLPKAGPLQPARQRSLRRRLSKGQHQGYLRRKTS